MLEEKLTPKDIESMDYTKFVALIEETNRPSGGKKTIRTILQNCFLNKESNVLEIGSTTGFTSLEIQRLIDCNVYGLDICSDSIAIAKKEVSKDKKSSKVHFLNKSALSIPFENEYFDLIICGNATSFLDEKEKAMEECIRVLKPWGFLSITPIYYVKQPPKDLVKKVSETLECEIKVWNKNFWLDLFTKKLELYFIEDYGYEYLGTKTIENYASYMANKSQLNKISIKTKEAIKKRIFDSMSLFNENLKYTNYSIILLRKRVEPEETELFKTYKIKGR